MAHVTFIHGIANKPEAAELLRIWRRTLAIGGEDALALRPHVVVSHSMGTVIAYNCLKRVAGCPPVDGLITLGSPLGLDEIQDRMAPEWTRSDGFPRDRVHGDWINVFDRLDPVCGLDPELADDYRRDDAGIVRDVAVTNPGVWRHSTTKYFRQPALRRDLRRMPDL